MTAVGGLTPNAIERLLNGEKFDSVTLQVINVREMQSQKPGDLPRYRLSVSDGSKLYHTCMTGAQLYDRIRSGELNHYPVINVQTTITNIVGNKLVLVIADYTVVERPGMTIGNPVDYEHPLQGQRPISTVQPATVNVSTVPFHQQPIQSVDAEQRQPQYRSSIGDYKSGGSNVRFSVTHQADSLAKRGGGLPTSSVITAGTGPSGRGQAEQTNGCHPIISLTPYQNRWRIRARVTKKSNVRTYSNSKGEGKLFSLELLDESGEIKATAFQELADKFYNMFQENGVYYISGGNIKPANKQYTSIKNDYELTFNQQTEVSPCYDYNVSQMPTVSFDFTKFDRLSGLPAKSMIDVIGILRTVFDEQTVNSRKTNEPLKKRDVLLVDETLNSVTLTLWREQGDQFKDQADGKPVVAIKGAITSDFGGGVSLAMGYSSQVHFNPDIKESHTLRGWYDGVGYRLEFKPLSTIQISGGFSGANEPPKLIAIADAQNLGAASDKGDYFSIKAAVQFCPKAADALYMACPTENCNKKVIDQQNGNYRCEKCNREFQTFKYRMLLQIQVSDFTSTKYLTLFGEAGEQLLGKTTEELGQLKDHNEEEYQAVFDDILFKPYIFRVRAKTEIFNDESRVKWTCVKVSPVDFTQYGKLLEEQIQKMERMM